MKAADVVRSAAVPVVLTGGLCGLAWAAGLRGFMSQVAAGESAVTWTGTFVWVLLPGVIVGALLGWAEHIRRTGGRRHWRWLALSPLLFASVLLPGLLHPGSALQDGIGGGAIGVPVFGIIGGFALSGRGRRWPRVLCGFVALLAIPSWALTAGDIAPQLELTEPRGMWAALYYWSFLAVLMLASSIPQRDPLPDTGVDQGRSEQDEPDHHVQRNLPKGSRT
jgi:hypothetical protein